MRSPSCCVILASMFASSSLTRVKHLELTLKERAGHFRAWSSVHFKEGCCGGSCHHSCDDLSLGVRRGVLGQLLY